MAHAISPRPGLFAARLTLPTSSIGRRAWSSARASDRSSPKASSISCVPPTGTRPIWTRSDSLIGLHRSGLFSSTAFQTSLVRFGSSKASDRTQPKREKSHPKRVSGIWPQRRSAPLRDDPLSQFRSPDEVIGKQREERRQGIHPYFVGKTRRINQKIEAKLKRVLTRAFSKYPDLAVRYGCRLLSLAYFHIFGYRTEPSDWRLPGTLTISAAAMQHHRVYILGPGSIGTFMAYGLNRGPDPPPTVLIFQDTATASKFNERKTLKLLTSPERPERNVLGVVGISVDALYYLPLTIENLVVCTKAHQTINALKSVAYRLLPTSTVLLMQNGMGLLDEIYREIWPNPALRPRIMIGINTHGVTRTSALGVVTRNGSSGLVTFARVRPTTHIRAHAEHIDLLNRRGALPQKDLTSERHRIATMFRRVLRARRVRTIRHIMRPPNLPAYIRDKQDHPQPAGSVREGAVDERRANQRRIGELLGDLEKLGRVGGSSSEGGFADAPDAEEFMQIAEELLVATAEKAAAEERVRRRIRSRRSIMSMFSRRRRSSRRVRSSKSTSEIREIIISRRKRKIAKLESITNAGIKRFSSKGVVAVRNVPKKKLRAKKKSREEKIKSRSILGLISARRLRTRTFGRSRSRVVTTEEETSETAGAGGRRRRRSLGGSKSLSSIRELIMHRRNKTIRDLTSNTGTQDSTTAAESDSQGYDYETLTSILKDYEEQAPPGHYDLLDYTYHNKFVTRLIESPILGAREVSYSDLLRTQVQKMVANCCINPLTAILDVPNGHMASSKYMRRAIVAIIRETVKVLDVLPEIKATFSTYEREGMLDVAQLKEYVLSIARQTADNTSSMRADILAGRTTEIDYLNGYIAASGRKYGVQTPINSYLAHIVKHKTSSDGNDMIYSPGSVVQTILSEDSDLVTAEAEAEVAADSKKVVETDDPALREASEVEDRSVA